VLHLQELHTVHGPSPVWVGLGSRWFPLSRGGSRRGYGIPHRRRPITCSPPKATLSWRFDGRVSPSAGHQLRGCLVITPPRLSPASPSQPLRTHPRPAAWKPQTTCLRASTRSPAPPAHARLTAEQARMIRSPRSARATGPHRYYKAVRLCAPHRYSALTASTTLGNSLSRPAAGNPRHRPAAARDDRFPRSTQEPKPGSRHLHAGRHPGGKQVSPRPIPGQDPKPGFAIVSELSTRHQSIAHARLPGSHLTRSPARLSPTTLSTNGS
jgi:hypothetical protein